MRRLFSYHRSLAAAFAVALTCTVAPRAEAQYFGRNKVQYEKMDFRVLLTSHYDVHFYPAESLAVADAARMAERWHARHKALFGIDFAKNPLIFYADHPDFQQSNVIEQTISEGTGGVTEGLLNRVIMPMSPTYGETDHVLGHELVHVFQYQTAKDSGKGLSNLNNIPLWLIEGMAEYMSLGRRDANTAMWLRDALRNDNLPTMKQLTTDPRFFPYRYGQALWAFIAGEYGDEAVVRVYKAALVSGWEKGIVNVLRVSSDSLSKAWHAAIRRDYARALTLAAPDQVGRAVAIGRARGEENVSPSISPDGKYVAYYSSRGLFGLDLYVAEVATGRVVKQLTSVTNDRHFDAISFISTAGTWSPDGKQVAFIAYREGDTEIQIVDVESGRTVRKISPAGIGAVNDPAWSPDGRSIAFSGMKGGISDLYLFDLGTGATTQLTTGREAEIQPAWSPDGRTLAFVTDRGPGTDFTILSHGPMRLALIDITSREIRLVPSMGDGKEINPQFSTDGTALYFISDIDGVSDVYRRVLASGATARLTNVATGVSGFTALSPALSVARTTGEMLVSVFDKQSFGIRSVKPGEVTAVIATQPAPAQSAAVLPSFTATTAGPIARSLADPRAGLPARTVGAIERYKSSLQAQSVSSASLGASIGGGYGSGVGGAVGVGFSDLLGNRVAQAVVQGQGELRDFGGQVMFLDRSRRWNWGASGYHIPQAGAFATYEPTTFTVDGQSVPGAVITQEIQRVYFTGAQLFTQYPLSSTRRFELGVGAERVGFSTQVESLYVSGDAALRQTRDDLPSGAALGFTRASLAYVGDNSFGGFTSPIAGGRHRIEVAPQFGSLSMVNLTGDFRKYFFAKPMTLAIRGLHFGRYGKDSESNRMRPLYVGQPTLIRGYEPNDFSPSDCSAPSDAQDSCPQFTRLNGSRIAAANIELRIPVFGNEQLGLFNVPFLPLEIAPFADAGVAWTGGSSPALRFDQSATSDRIPVLSAGVTSRMNLFGYIIAEIYYVKPFQRPGRGAYWAFQIAPGW
jgi:Tol biopolymer transport system component